MPWEALEHGAVRGLLACTFALVLPETDLQPGAQSQRDQQEQHQQAAARPAAAQRWRGLKARSDSQTSSQMPATNDDR